MEQVILKPLAEQRSAKDAQQDKKALDELFIQVKTYRKSSDFQGLLTFIRRFRFYSPYNAMLIQIQMPGAKFVATPRAWLDKYKRTVKTGSRPIVILQSMGPVMFVFDVSDSEPLPDAPALPKEVTNPFDIPKGNAKKGYAWTVLNAVRDGVEIVNENAGSLLGGSIRVCNIEQNNEISDISLDLVLKAAGLIERMGRERLKKR